MLLLALLKLATTYNQSATLKTRSDSSKNKINSLTYETVDFISCIKLITSNQ